MHTLILGFDSFDPQTFETLASQGRLPNLAEFAQAGHYSRFQVSDPPQTEVSWTSIATGLDPGGHGIFDFVHRDPSSYTPYVSLLPTQRKAFGVQFRSPTQARTLFDEAASLGYPATSLFWPATFPARLDSPVHTLPGLGTPDITGKLGVGILYTDVAEMVQARQKTQVKVLESTGKGRFKGQLEGPLAKKGGKVNPASLEFQLEASERGAAKLSIAGQSIPLAPGEWSPVLEIPFKLGAFITISALTRAILAHHNSGIRLYFLPLQIHPLRSPWRYAAPPAWVRQAWRQHGPFLTLGWPQDTTALEEGCITDEQFLTLCESIFDSRERLLMGQLDSFKEGVLAAIFDDLDRVQHMFRRSHPEVVEAWYVRLDSLVGRIRQRLAEQGKQKIRLLVVSDHGFSDFEQKVHLNRWLLENGYLTKLNGGSSNGRQPGLEDVDWPRSQAYAVGLNSLYLNLAGREGQGSVPTDQAQIIVEKLRSELLSWQAAEGRPVVQRTLTRQEAFSGPMVSYGPDLLIGYAPGFRASAETGLGKWGESALTPNADHWRADHCIDSQAVPGVIFCNQGFGGLQNPSFRHFPLLAIGKEISHPQTPPTPPASASAEEKKTLEERLKSLGYL